MGLVKDLLTPPNVTKMMGFALVYRPARAVVQPAAEEVMRCLLAASRAEETLALASSQRLEFVALLTEAWLE